VVFHREPAEFTESEAHRDVGNVFDRRIREGVVPLAAQNARESVRALTPVAPQTRKTRSGFAKLARANFSA
jgi:hypothetical protein